MKQKEIKVILTTIEQATASILMYRSTAAQNKIFDHPHLWAYLMS